MLLVVLSVALVVSIQAAPMPQGFVGAICSNQLGEIFYPGMTYLDDCNICVCGAGGVGACTMKMCNVAAPGGICYDSDGEYHYAGQTYKHDCNTCTCGNGGVARCTKMMC